MSQFISAAGPLQFTSERDDYRACGEDVRNDEDLYLPRIVPQTYENFQEFTGMASTWWPCRSTFFGTGSGDQPEGNDWNPCVKWADTWTRAGCNGRLAFVGYTRNENGNIVAGCTVKCFRVANDSLQSSVVSDANGYYQATTPYYEAHYLVVQMPTTPARAGASVNTILPG